jgi:hypothetical protein
MKSVLQKMRIWNQKLRITLPFLVKNITKYNGLIITY